MTYVDHYGTHATQVGNYYYAFDVSKPGEVPAATAATASAAMTAFEDAVSKLQAE
ncbi:MAG TPA: hypothetical protein VFL85_00750 [Candidatus Saccharimonadales bacterium]|nr:hypothetical protein [Candidatus Saccharimonadales bacterium]